MSMKSLCVVALLLWASLFFSTRVNAQIRLSYETNAVTGLPYSASQETDTTRTLPDGAITVLKQLSRLYRDSNGRMRVELFLPIGWNPAQEFPEIVTIIDPIAQVEYTLRPPKHTVSLLKLNAVPRESSSLYPPVSAPPGCVLKERLDHLLTDPEPPQTKLPTFLPKMASEDLGTQMMEGLLVKGERTTSISAAGCDGKHRFVVEVDDVWTSTELKLTVLSKHSSPRSLDYVTRITTLNRSEPDPNLFRVPPDYAVVDPAKNY